MQLLDCADDLDGDRLAPSALSTRLSAIAAALPSHVPNPAIQLGQILERTEHFVSSDAAAQLTAIAQQLIAASPSVQGLNTTGLFEALI